VNVAFTLGVSLSLPGAVPYALIRRFALPTLTSSLTHSLEPSREPIKAQNLSSGKLFALFHDSPVRDVIHRSYCIQAPHVGLLWIEDQGIARMIFDKRL
jgi:hypothetical protein